MHHRSPFLVRSRGFFTPTGKFSSDCHTMRGARSVSGLNQSLDSQQSGDYSAVAVHLERVKDPVDLIHHYDALLEQIYDLPPHFGLGYQLVVLVLLGFHI